LITRNVKTSSIYFAIRNYLYCGKKVKEKFKNYIIHISFMGAQTFQIHRFLTSRPNGSLQRTIRTLDFHDCRVCQECCMGGVVVPVTNTDPNARRIFTTIKSRFGPEHIREYPNGFHIESTSEGTCPFLTTSGCSAYDYRPLVCRMVPFVLKSETAVVLPGQTAIAILASDCRLMKALRSGGVTFLYSGELTGSSTTQRILSQSHDGLLSAISHGLPVNVEFLVSPFTGERFFPIL